MVHYVNYDNTSKTEKKLYFNTKLLIILFTNKLMASLKFKFPNPLLAFTLAI